MASGYAYLIQWYFFAPLIIVFLYLTEAKLNVSSFFAMSENVGMFFCGINDELSGCAGNSASYRLFLFDAYIIDASFFWLCFL